MRFLIQRVREASVTVEGEITGQIGKGYLVLLGVCDTDTEAEAAQSDLKRRLRPSV